MASLQDDENSSYDIDGVDPLFANYPNSIYDSIPDNSLYDHSAPIGQSNSALGLLPQEDILQGGEAVAELKSIVNNQETGSALPTLDEFDKDVDFKLTFQNSKNGVYFAEPLEKVFVKINTVFYVNVHFVPTSALAQEKWYLRATLVYSEELSEPVKRCHNHVHQDNDYHRNPIPEIVYHVLRSEVSDTQYFGSENANSVKDRFALIIPLPFNSKSGYQLTRNNLVALKFVCQNSCIGRKQTAIIFSLQNENSEDLAKKVYKIKVCSCPKRDMEKELDTIPSKCRKRQHLPSEMPPGKKVLKPSKIKEEPIETGSTTERAVTFPFKADNVGNMIDMLKFAHGQYARLYVCEKTPEKKEQYQEYMLYYASLLEQLK